MCGVVTHHSIYTTGCQPMGPDTAVYIGLWGEIYRLDVGEVGVEVKSEERAMQS